MKNAEVIYSSFYVFVVEWTLPTAQLLFAFRIINLGLLPFFKCACR